MIELHELEESQVSVESVRGWCVEEQAMEMDIAMLQQVEELERKVTAASLQVKVRAMFPHLEWWSQSLKLNCWASSVS